MKVRTPWTDKQVEALNDYQGNSLFHPYTCPGDKEACKQNRNLIATKDGWVCHCGQYTQDWFHG